NSSSGSSTQLHRQLKHQHAMSDGGQSDREAPPPAESSAPSAAAAPAALSATACGGFLSEPKPVPGVRYPLQVQYCGACSLPLELCEFSPDPGACRAWLEQNLPEEFARLNTGAAAADEADDDKKKRQTRGGKGGNKEAKKKKEAADQARICLSRAQRGKRKSVTVVTGLSSFGIDLKEASRVFGQKFATGASVTGNGDEIVIQGDVRDDLFDLLPERWPSIDEERIEDLGDLKR
ncbi:hypothetical protein BOX15_Mlig024619g1, partial [Macrostomum lignano]